MSIKKAKQNKTKKEMAFRETSPNIVTTSRDGALSMVSSGGVSGRVGRVSHAMLTMMDGEVGRVDKLHKDND